MRTQFSLRGRAHAQTGANVRTNVQGSFKTWTHRLTGALLLALACSVSPALADEPADAADDSEHASQSSCARLSILNGGEPRGDQGDEALADKHGAFSRTDLNDGVWLFLVEEETDADDADTDSDADTDEQPLTSDQFRLGNVSDRARPLAGDFDGDGESEFALYLDGDWFIDFNSNGEWDENDLFIRLGSKDDQPLVGDWDGDGKDDIGVFGRHNAQDGKHTERATAGLPDAENKQASVANNGDTPRPIRLLQKTASGNFRAEQVDYVLIYDDLDGIAVAGDFNGDGVDTVAVFENGQWFIDADGDGQPSDADLTGEFGQAGDLPFVADFNGDGIDEIGVFRNGVWFVDTNNNQRLDDEDLSFKLGAPGDRPAPADIRGVGKDAAAVYRARTANEKQPEPAKTDSAD